MTANHHSTQHTPPHSPYSINNCKPSHCTQHTPPHSPHSTINQKPSLLNKPVSHFKHSLCTSSPKEEQISGREYSIHEPKIHLGASLFLHQCYCINTTTLTSLPAKRQQLPSKRSTHAYCLLHSFKQPTHTSLFEVCHLQHCVNATASTKISSSSERQFVVLSFSSCHHYQK